MHSKVLIIVVLCLAVFYCQSVVSLKTGYKYKSNDILNKDELHDDLKCMHLFSGLFHMQLTGYIFYQRIIMAGDVIDMIKGYNTRAGVYTLYVLDKSKIGALWLLHLYTRMVIGSCDFSCTDVNKEREKARIIAKMSATHGYVTDLLKKETETESCRPGNLFDRYDEWMDSHNWSPNIGQIKQALDENCDEFHSMVKANMNELPPGLNYESFRFRELFMNSFGGNCSARLDLMHVYNVQVNWADTNVHLQNVWTNAKALDWKSTKLQTIKKYYKTQYNFLKVIFLRLTLKHLLYIEQLSGHTQVSYLEQWHHLVLEFGNMLHIRDDPHIADLLIALAGLTNPQECINNVKLYLEAVLDLICKTLKCNATSSMNLDGQEFKLPCRSIDQDIANYVQSVSRQEPVELNSLANVKAFMLHLTKIFINVDFGVIHSLIEYIKNNFK